MSSGSSSLESEREKKYIDSILNLWKRDASSFDKLSLKETDFRTPYVKQAENELNCKLIDNHGIYKFACYLLFKIIKKCQQLRFPDIEIKKLIEKWTSIATDGDIILTKAGYDCNLKDENPNALCNKAISFDNFNDFLKFNVDNRVSFLSIMGAYYKFQITNKITQLCIDGNQELQRKFLIAMREYFLIPDDMTYEDVKKIVDNSYGAWFYLWVFTFLISDKHNLMHHSLGAVDSDYIRMWNKNKEFGDRLPKKDFHLINLQDYEENDCKKSAYYEYLSYGKKNIMIGNTYMTARQNSVWFNLMKKFNKQVIAGPSSSSVLSYQFLFDISEIFTATDNENVKILILMCLIADYYNFFHSISEILQEYTVEANLPKYDLSQNDFEYINRLLQSIDVNNYNFEPIVDRIINEKEGNGFVTLPVIQPSTRQTSLPPPAADDSATVRIRPGVSIVSPPSKAGGSLKKKRTKKHTIAKKKRTIKRRR